MPEEIKKGLECCNRYNGCQSCPYDDEVEKGWGCCVQRNADALAYIRQLEAKLDQVKRTTSNDNVNGNVMAILDEIRVFKREAKEFATSDYRTGYLSALSALEGFIAGLPAVYIPKWISVEEELPSGMDYFDDGTAEPAEYIVKVKNASVATIAMFDGKEWIPAQYNGITEDRWFASRVTHWMPLPEPPEEVRQ